MERGISVTSLEPKMGLEKKIEYEKNFAYLVFHENINLYIQGGRRDTMHSFSPSKWK